MLELAQAAKLSEFDATKVALRPARGRLRRRSPSGRSRAPRARRRRRRARAAQHRLRRRRGEPGPTPYDGDHRVQPDLPRDPRRGRASRRWTASSSPPRTPRSEAQALSASPVLKGLSFDPDGTLRRPQALDRPLRGRPRAARQRAGRLAQAGALGRDVLPPLPGRRAARVERRRGSRPPGEGAARDAGAASDRRGRAPLLTADLPGSGGKLKVAPEDFEVEEVPAYLPAGQGEHLYLWVEKRGPRHAGVAKQLAAAARACRSTRSATPASRIATPSPASG